MYELISASATQKKKVRSFSLQDIFNPFLLYLLLKRLGKEIVSKLLDWMESAY